jgi:hypothetical protein
MILLSSTRNCKKNWKRQKKNKKVKNATVAGLTLAPRVKSSKCAIDYLRISSKIETGSPIMAIQLFLRVKVTG